MGSKNQVREHRKTQGHGSKEDILAMKKLRKMKEERERGRLVSIKIITLIIKCRQEGLV